MGLPTKLLETRFDPRHQVILEGALDDLVKYNDNDLMYVCQVELLNIHMSLNVLVRCQNID